MSAIYKTYQMSVIDKTDNGGRVTISTADLDRDHDIVQPLGARIDSYLRNPVVQFGHRYDEPWATVGRTTKLEVDDRGIVAEFELRPPANEFDPQNVVQLLWNGGWIKSASVGFIPLKADNNEHGGRTFEEWELLEWSLVPVPAQARAIRLAAKSLKSEGDPVTLELESTIEEKRGRVLSATNENKLRKAAELLQEVLAQVEEATDDEKEVVLRPMPNEHACRLRDPGDFQADSFRRTTRRSDGKEYSVIMGRLQGQDTMTEQAYRYPKDSWSAEQARSHCGGHDGKFEPASEEQMASAVAKAITDEDKRVLVSELGRLNMTDLVATHRRLHQFAAQGNLLTGFSREDMNWFHAACETELRKRAEKDDREPPEPTPLEWGKAEGEEETLEPGEEEKHMPRRISIIAAREKPKEGKIEPDTAAATLSLAANIEDELEAEALGELLAFLSEIETTLEVRK